MAKQLLTAERKTEPHWRKKNKSSRYLEFTNSYEQRMNSSQCIVLPFLKQQMALVDSAIAHKEIEIKKIKAKVGLH